MSCKGWRFAAALCAALVLGPVGAHAAPVNILFVGNSFTNWDTPNLPQIVGELAVSAGYERPNVVNVSVDSQSLNYHRNSPTTLGAIASGTGGRPWDFVVLQDLSYRPTNSIYGDPAGFRDDAAWLYNDVKRYNPAAKVVLYETWGYGTGFGWYPSVFANFTDMQRQLHGNYYDAALNYIPAHVTVGISPDVMVAPCGDAWGENANAWGLNPGAQNLYLYQSDAKHMNDYGAYLNGLVMFEAMYGYNPVGLSYAGNAGTWAPYLQGIAAQTYIDTLTGRIDALTGGGAPATVFIPEPAALAVLAPGALLVLGRRGRTRRAAA